MRARAGISARAAFAAVAAGALLGAPLARAADRAPDASLGPKKSVAPDAALQGSLESMKARAEPGGPALHFETFRKRIEIQVSEKRREEIASLQKLIQLGGDEAELPGWYFRLAELLWEESQYFFFEAGRRDDQLIALGNGDAGRRTQLQAEKKGLEDQSRRHQDQAVSLYAAIAKRYPKYPRLDEVLFFLGETLTRRDRNDPEGLRAYRLLIQRFPKSRYVPDAWLALGEYHFEKANGPNRIGNLREAQKAYQTAASFTESSVYGFALYKQAWVHYNLNEYHEALELFRAVIYFGALPTTTVPADRKLALVKEARKDYVRTYSHVGSPEGAYDEFRRVGGEEGWWDMMKTLAGLYFDEGKDRDAILVYHRLIRERRIAPDAPFFQSRIVTAAGRMGRKEIAVQQAHVFVGMLAEIEQSAAAKDETSRKVLEDARRDAENTLRTLAVQYHNEWKKTRDEPVAGYAASVYRDYLQLFPESKTAYDMRFFFAELLYALADFEAAGAEYEAVAAQDIAAVKGMPGKPGGAPRKPGRFFRDALENAVFARDVVAKKLDDVEKRAPTDPKKRLPLAPVRQKLADACTRYLEHQPKGDKWVEIAYKLANLHYRHNAFGDATDLFTRIALDHPAHELSGYATNLVLDAYNLLGDWRNVNGWAKRFYANAALLKAHPALKDDLARIIEQSAFKVIEEHERAKDWEGAAEAYFAFVRDWPGSKLAPTALYNASVDWARGGRYDKAIEVREAILSRYPNDALAPKCLLDNADAYAAVADFDKAADLYERYFHLWKRSRDTAVAARAKRGKLRSAAAADDSAAVYEEKKATDAIINAAVFRAGLRQLGKAEAASLAYLESWPKGPDAKRLFLSLADLYARQNLRTKELRQLEEYQLKYAKDPDEWLSIQHRIAQLLEKSGNRSGAAKAYADGLAYYKARRSRVNDTGLPLVAHAMYLDLEPEFVAYDRITLNVAPKFLRSQLEVKGKKLRALETQYGNVVKLKQAEPAICALYKIGLGYHRFAQTLLEAPVPREIRAQADLVQEYKAQLSQFASGPQQKAVEGLELAMNASRDYGVVNDCARKATELLVKYEPEKHGPSPEVIPGIARADVADRPVGYGLLATIQTAPAPAASRPARPEALPPLRPAAPAAPAATTDEPGDDEAAREARQPERAAPVDPPALKKKSGARDDDEDLLP
jgi:outer membrane protein assembly factor BamD (BamD/ComL family)